jgi:hypothetical protein
LPIVTNKQQIPAERVLELRREHERAKQRHAKAECKARAERYVFQRQKKAAHETIEREHRAQRQRQAQAAETSCWLNTKEVERSFQQRAVGTKHPFFL